MSHARETTHFLLYVLISPEAEIKSFASHNLHTV